jgi:hypothetical protein
VKQRIALSLLALLTVGLVVSLRARRPTNRVVLPDGTRVTLETTTYGTTHNPQVRPPWLIALDAVLPDRIEGLIGPPRLGCGFGFGSGSSLTLWLNFQAGHPLRSTNLPRGLSFELSAGNGPGVLGSTGGTCGGGIGFSLHAVHFESFPRREPNLTLRILAKNQLLAELPVQNPVQGPFPTWSPQPLPTRITNGPLEIELSGLDPLRYSTGDGERISYQPKWSLRERGQTTEDWAPTLVRFEDPTGNSSYTGLSSGEPVWRLRTVWFQRPEAAHDADIARFSDLPVPAPEQRILTNAVRTVRNLTLRLIGIAGPGAYAWSNRVYQGSRPNRNGGSGSSVSRLGGMVLEEYERSQTHLLFAVDGLRPEDRIVARGRDDQGRSFSVTATGELPGSLTMDLPLAEGSKILDLVLIPQSPVPAEFYLVAPPP